MPLEEPAWWYAPAGNARVRLLRPLSRVWDRVSRHRMARPARHRPTLPVICIGNFTAGGTGKTPLALLIARLLVARNLRPVFLTRGYGGRRTGPWWVEPSSDPARDVGDEALLLARIAPVLIARDRVAGAQLIEGRQPRADVIIMDDGLQNPALAKDLRIAVVDAIRGFGNGEVIPAGPLRADLDFQLGHADAVVVNQPPNWREAEAAPDATDVLRTRYFGPVLQATTLAAGPSGGLRGGPVVAFAGIANPQRFYALLASLGAQLAETVSFADHHPFTAAEAADLLSCARSHGARLVTTEKDWVRLRGGAGPLAELAAASQPLAIRLHLDERDQARLLGLIEGVLRPGTGAPDRQA